MLHALVLLAFDSGQSVFKDDFVVVGDTLPLQLSLTIMILPLGHARKLVF